MRWQYDQSLHECRLVIRFIKGHLVRNLPPGRLNADRLFKIK